MSHDNYLAHYRGELQATYCYQEWVVFVSQHRESQATALYRFNLDEMRLHEDALSCGATALTANPKTKTLWLATEEGRLYQTAITTGKPTLLKKLPVFEQPIIKIVHLRYALIVVLQANSLTLIDTKRQTRQQHLHFSLSDHATVIASDATGQFIALGMQSGEVAVYEYREQQLHFSAKANLHQGQVTALQFEPRELRFFSAGEDKRLLSTHALGELQALDRGKKKNHNGVISTIVVGEKRFFTFASDKSAKSWAYEGGSPVSWQNNLHKTIDAGLVIIKECRYLLMANRDNSLRVVGIDVEERFTTLKQITRDGYAWADNALQQADPLLREKAVRFLIHYDDKKALDRLKKQLACEHDKATRELIVKLATKATHPHAVTLLEEALCDQKHASVRRLAFDGLEKQAKTNNVKTSPHEYDLRYLSLVLQSHYDDIGCLALRQLAILAKKQPRAEQLLLATLNHQQWRFREFAFSQLETLYAKKNPKAGLQALQSRYADLQRAAIIRLFQRGHLKVIEVKRAIALLQDHQDALVRQTAFLVSILSQPTLTTILKAREKDLARQLQELENFELLADQSAVKPSLAANVKQSFTTQKAIALTQLTHEDYVPLLQGMSSRHADICFTASFALAVLEDTRAFGVLLLLSHDRDTDIRVGVCKAFAWLKHANSIEVLQNLLHDSQAAVYDAAFSALQTIQQPLALARVGLAVEQNAIQLRALTLLLEWLQKNEHTESTEKTTMALALLKTALNSSFATIRQETFKACLNRLLGGDVLQTLQLLLQSHYEDIHQEVLNELTAVSQVKQPTEWALPLVQQLLLNNTFASIRQQAFELGVKYKKKFDPLTVLRAALASEFVDTRQHVLQYLLHKPSKDNYALLLPLLNDDDRQLRHQAFNALILPLAYEHQDSQLVLKRALESRYDDIRVAAAKASAALGEVQAYVILLTLATQPEPEKVEDKQRWQSAVINALQGLALLGDSRAFEVVTGFLTCKHKKLLNAAADALPMVSAVSHRAALQHLLKNDVIKIRAAAVLALAYTVDTTVHQSIDQVEIDQIEGQTDRAMILTVLADNRIKRELSHSQLLTATVCLGQVTPQVLQHFVMTKENHLRSQFILFAFELLQYAGTPVLSLQSLAVEEPRLQQMGADLLSRYHDKAQCWQYVANWLNRSAGKESLHWAFTPAMLQQYSAIVVMAKPFIKVRFLVLLQAWDQRVSMEQWQLKMAAFMERYKTALPEILFNAQQADLPVIDAYQIQQWRALAFGAYLGRVRAKEVDCEVAQRLQMASLHGMRYLALQDQQLKPSVESCLLTLLNHPTALIRQTAFDDLQMLHMDLERLGHAATTSPESDIAKQGLTLLVAHYPLKKSLGLLRDLLITGDKVLAIEAYHLSVNEEGLVKTAPSALQSYTIALRYECLSALAKQYEEDACQQQLLLAVDNDHAEVAIKAAHVLARHQHPAIFVKLQSLFIQSHDEKQQKAILRALNQLQTPNVAVFLADYLQQQKATRDLPLALIYQVIASYRYVKVAEDLLTRFATHDQEQTFLFKCLLVISGYDQPIYDHVYNRDDDETHAPPHWLEKQHTRHHELVVRLFETALQNRQAQRAQSLLVALSWMPTDIPDAVLLKVVPLVDVDFLKLLTAVIGWRYYKRNQSAALVKGLLTLLAHQEADIQFLAAEALAKGGQTQGKAVLLSSINYLENIEYRQRAVLALGESADPQVLDVLLKLAKEKEHVLQATAIEAIGHMAENDREESLFKLLRTALQGASEYSDMVIHALNGLRWFNTLPAWQLIAEKAQQVGYYHRAHAIRCLRYWDHEYSRQLLLELIAHEQDESIVEVALKVTKQFWQPSKTAVNAVDFALFKGHCAFLDETLVERISCYASVRVLFDLLNADFAIDQDADASHDAIAAYRQKIDVLHHALLQRETLTEKTLVEHLSTEKRVSQLVAVQLLIRQHALQVPTKENINTLLEQRYQQWLILHTERRQGQSQSRQHLANFDALHTLLTALLWCNVTHPHHAASTYKYKTQITILQCDEKAHIALQKTILTALLAQRSSITTEQQRAIEKLLQSPVLNLRRLANQVLSQQDKQRYGNQVLAWHYLMDKPQSAIDDSFICTIQQAAASDAEQALALPILITRNDRKTLITIADNKSYEETVRIGAIEALGRLADQQVEEKLSNISKNEQDEDISKAAYRALRRSQRIRTKETRSVFLK